jgi:hypothetical protein
MKPSACNLAGEGLGFGSGESRKEEDRCMRTQFCFVGLIAVGLAVGSLMLADAASACKGTTQSANRGQGIHGRIVSVNNNSITVAMHQHHKKGQAAGVAAKAAQPMTQTFQIGANTQVAFVGGKNAKLATVNDLKAGEEVAIEGPGGMAQKIAIMHHEHHKKGAS